MRVLHIWNTAGVGSLISKHLKRNNIDSVVLMRKGYDPFGMCEYYGDTELNMSGGSFISHAINTAKDFDIIHVHGLYRIVDRLRSIYPKKKIILQHHGTELTTGDINELIHYYKFVDEIITSTSDLNSYLNRYKIDNTLIENAVDTELFKPIERSKFKPALMFDIRYVDHDSSIAFAQSHCDWDINVIDRESNHVMYSEMPIFLNQYSKFIDVKCYEWTDFNPGQAYSKTGRESLACGLDVLNYKGEIVRGLPKEFTPEYQIKNIIDLYNR